MTISKRILVSVYPKVGQVIGACKCNSPQIRRINNDQPFMWRVTCCCDAQYIYEMVGQPKRY